MMNKKQILAYEAHNQRMLNQGIVITNMPYKKYFFHIISLSDIRLEQWLPITKNGIEVVRS
jgi:hypothetical protein